jgi:peptidylprolyl isomerase
MESLQKFWPLFLLLGIGVVALALIGLDNSKDGKGTKEGESIAKEFDEEGAVTLPSGLKYIDEKEGEGEEAKAGDRVSVLYTGRLVDSKKVFDSTSNRNDEPFTFTLGRSEVIKGWDQGVAGMKVGGKRKLLIPSNLGYGPRGAGKDIPPNADLEFDVELLKIDK